MKNSGSLGFSTFSRMPRQTMRPAGTGAAGMTDMVPLSFSTAHAIQIR